MSKSAGINFGLPNTEYIVRINNDGEATSCYNQDTDTEYIGGGGGGDCFITNDVEGTLDKTWQEIHDALENLGIGKVFIYQTYEDGGNTYYGAYVVVSCTSEEGYYEVAGCDFGYLPHGVYVAESADGYPILD